MFVLEKAALPPMDFEVRAAKEILEEDGLVIFARGLGVNSLLRRFMVLYWKFPTTVLLVCTKAKLPMLQECLAYEDGKDLAIVDSGVSIVERDRMYSRGGIVCITARCAVTDFLQERLRPLRVSGIIFDDAHKVDEDSVESFVSRLYRDGNPKGWVKAFSESPCDFLSGFSRLEKTMAALGVSKLFLWPRFHAAVVDSLSTHVPDVIEIKVLLDDHMAEIQKAIVVIMDTCLQDIKRHAKVELAELTIENGLLKSFDALLRNRLDPQWHKLSKQTKQTVQDMRTLRKLLIYLLRYSATSFYSFLQTLRKHSTNVDHQSEPSMWLLTDAADVLFKNAKQRVLRVHKASEEGKLPPLIHESSIHAVYSDPVTREAVRVEVVPDKPPKLSLLKQILKEIESDSRATEGKDTTSCSGSTVLIILRDDRAVAATKEYLEFELKHDHKQGGINMLSSAAGRQFVNYLRRTNDAYRNIGKNVAVPATVPFAGITAINSSANSILINPIVIPSASSGGAGSGGGGDEGRKPISLTLEQHAMLLLEEKIKEVEIPRRFTHEKRSVPQVTIDDYFSPDEDPDPVDAGPVEEDVAASSTAGNPGPTSTAPGKGNKRRKKNPDGLVPAWAGQGVATSMSNDASVSALRLEKEGPRMDNDGGDDGDDAAWWAKERPRIENSSTIDNHCALLPRENMVLFPLSQLSDEPMIIEKIRPQYVIICDPDLAVTRALELYKTSHPGRPLRVYFLVYENSVEEQQYLTSVKAEIEAFKKLIKAKEHMVISVEKDNPNSSYNREAQLARMDPAIAKRSMARMAMEDLVVVDMREFRSALPSLLHGSNIRIAPLTITVGDYILTPDICVERKSVSDLIGSFTSGRLYNQAEAMSRFFKYPTLLIEFDSKKAFCLTAATGLDDQIKLTSIHSRIVLLTRSFPKLRLLWSKSPYNTVTLFKMLKSNQLQPDVNVVASYGTGEEHDDGNENAIDENSILAKDILLNMPGVHKYNVEKLVSKVRNLASLSLMTKDEICDVIGDGNGALLFDFLHEKYL